VPLAGGTPVKLNGPIEEDGLVRRQHTISPDSSRVIYVTAREISIENYQNHLYSVPLTGGPPTWLDSSQVLGGYISYYVKISPDSSHIVYIVSMDVDSMEVWELYSVPLAGGPPVKLNGPLGQNGDVTRFALSPDSSHVVYIADQDTPNVEEMYSVPLTGGLSVKLNSPLREKDWSFTQHYDISMDSSHIVYIADDDTKGVYELYSMPMAGGPPVKLNGPLVENGDVTRFAISPDSSYVAYVADQDTDRMENVYAVSLLETAINRDTIYLPLARR
jgi:Tol biopolymer transport system component